jgi:hypothetical protein
MRPCRSIASVLVAALAAGAALAGSLEGRWRLVEETYGEGKGNLAGDHRPVELEFVRNGPELVATIRLAREGPALAWPAAPAADRTLRVLDREVAPVEGRARIRYVVEPAPGDDLALEIVEDYRVAADGTLAGTVDVTLLRAGEHAGSYRLHRRFERLR